MLLMLVIMTADVCGQNNYPPAIDCDKEVVYKKVNDTDLKLWIFLPPKHIPNKNVPAIVFFFGGGWKGGSPQQFVKHCEYLSARGMVAMVADYRVASRNDVKAFSCVEDAKSAIRWTRKHAAELGIDPDRIAAGGGSAGGHLAAATATLPQFDTPGENLEISSIPNALVLFNPALVLAPIGKETPEQLTKLEGLEERLGAKPEDMSPYHHIEPGDPPAIIFHGTEDKTVPFVTAQEFTNKMKALGNECILAAYEDEPHGFFNFGKKSNGPFISTVAMMDKFLVELGWLPPLPEAMKLD